MSVEHDKLNKIFSEALAQVSPEERERYLAGVCGPDQELRGQIDSLIEAHAQSGDFLRRSVVNRAGPPVDERLGSIVGRYKLLEKIGEGGMGVVYMAEQQEPVRRRVALKVIKLGMDTQQVVARFEAERQALALMDHPNIAKVLDAGATDTGRPYFVMELVQGVPITEFCDKNRLPAQERIKLFILVCQAIQSAHQKGIIHRDIKPNNILVTLNAGVAVPMVIDFGVAKATQQKLTEKTAFTNFATMIGTPAYMSPEQAEMSRLDVDTRSDIYGLGVLLYELLTGTTPFPEKRLRSASYQEMQRIIMEEEPERPSTRLLQKSINTSTLAAKALATAAPLSTDLDWIVMKCLEKDRARRYETANGVAADLKRHLENEPVLARPPSAAYRLQKAWRRNRTVFTAAAVIAVVLVAASGISAWQAVRANRAEALAKQHLAESEANAALATQRLAESEANATLATQRLADSEAISKFLTEVFQSPNPARDGRTITVAETLSNAVKKLEIDLAKQPESRAKLQATLGTTYFALGLYRDAISLQEKVRDHYLAVYGLENTNTLSAMDNLARSYGEVGRSEEAIKLGEQVLPLSRKVLGLEHPFTLKATSTLAICYFHADRRDEALKLEEQVLTLSRKVNGPEHADTLKAMNNMAIYYWYAGRRDEALKLREQVLTLGRKVLGPENPSTLSMLFNLSTVYDEAGRRDEALKLREELLPLRRNVLGPEHPDTVSAMDDLANSYYVLGHRNKALKLLEELLAIRRKLNGPEHPDNLWTIEYLAKIYDEADRRDEGIKMQEEALAIRRKVNGPEHPDTLKTMCDLANFYHKAGRRAEALKLLEEALALEGKVNDPEHLSTLWIMDLLAKIYAETGREDAALKLREQMLALCRKVRGPEHLDTLNALNAIAWRLAISDAAEIRNGTNAVDFAEEAVAATHRTNYLFLDTLAAAYAEAHQFDKAVAVQGEAIGLVQSEEERKGYDSRLKLYQANKPYRVKTNP